jgi:cytochrome c oxidase subunit IV
MIGAAEKTWLALFALTLLGALLAETGHAGWFLSLAVTAAIVVKGGLVIDRYMEMTTAKKSFRRILYIFAAINAAMVLLTQEFGEAIKQATTIF